MRNAKRDTRDIAHAYNRYTGRYFDTARKSSSLYVIRSQYSRDSTTRSCKKFAFPNCNSSRRSSRNQNFCKLKKILSRCRFIFSDLSLIYLSLSLSDISHYDACTYVFAKEDQSKFFESKTLTHVVDLCGNTVFKILGLYE